MEELANIENYTGTGRDGKYKKLKVQKIRHPDMYKDRPDINLKSKRSTLRCTEAVRFGRACKARVLHWNHTVERNLKDGEYKSLKYKKYDV